MSITAAMLETGMLDETGRLQDGFDQIQDDRLVINREKHIYLTGADIRQLQLAKAAVAAGIETLLQQQNTSAAQIKKVYVAGGFGFHIHKKSACRIGLFPKIFREKIVYLGNASLNGAVMLLGNRKKIQVLKELCKKTTSINLAESTAFSERYMENMSF